MNYTTMSNKEFAFSCLNLLKSHKVPHYLIQALTDSGYCRELFHSPKPILRQIRFEKPGKADLFDNSGHARYYRDVWEYNGCYYLVTNYWYGPNTNVKDNRTPFLSWVLSQIA